MNAFTPNPFDALAERLVDRIEGLERLLLERLPDPNAAPDELITAREASELLGISARTFEVWQARLGFPARKSAGHRRRWSKAEIIAYRDASCKATSAAER